MQQLIMPLIDELPTNVAFGDILSAGPGQL